MYYRPLPSNVTIKNSEIEGLGLFATEDIPENTDLGMTHIYDERFPDNHIRVPLGGFFNHSNEPNCTIVSSTKDDFGNEIEHLRLVTIKNIKAGEELTAFYTLYIPE